MKTRSESPIILAAARTFSPVIQLVALYVIFHGHYSPGGGFQGGVLLAASFVLIRLGLGSSVGQLQFPTRAGVTIGIVGLSLYAGVGFLALFAGGNFLEYGRLPFLGMTAAGRHSLAILLVELGVALAVPAVLTALYDELLGSERDA
jgi:multicomponent Na+:H+ antiporter subunit B